MENKLFLVDSFSDSNVSMLTIRLVPMGFKKATAAGKGRYLVVDIRNGQYWVTGQRVNEAVETTSFVVLSQCLDMYMKQPWYKKMFK